VVLAPLGLFWLMLSLTDLTGGLLAASSTCSVVRTVGLPVGMVGWLGRSPAPWVRRLW
jgi:hypothetical protein